MLDVWSVKTPPINRPQRTHANKPTVAPGPTREEGRSPSSGAPGRRDFGEGPAEVRPTTAQPAPTQAKKRPDAGFGVADSRRELAVKEEREWKAQEKRARHDAHPILDEPPPSTALVVVKKTPEKGPRAVVPYQAQAETGRRPLVDVWLAGLKPTTLRAYKGDLEQFALYLGLADSKAAAAHLISRTHGEANELVSSYKSAMLDAGLASATINRRISAIRSVVHLANTLGYIPWLIPIKGVKHKKYRDTRGPVDDDVEKLFAAAAADTTVRGPRDTLVLALLFTLGLRRAEAAALCVKHIDSDGRLSILGKGSRERTRVNLPTEVASLVKARIVGKPPEAPLLHLTTDGIYKALKRVARAAGVDPDKIRPHGLRHGSVTSLLDRGVDKRTVTAFARHQDSKTTDIYDDNRNDSHGNAAAVLARATMGPKPSTELDELRKAAAQYMSADQVFWDDFVDALNAGKQWTVKGLDTLLTSSGDERRRNSETVLNVLLAHLQQGRVTVTTTELPTHPAPVPAEYLRGGGEDHGQLKANAAMWLVREKIATKTTLMKLECSCAGYRIDVAVPAKNVYVECGDTECSKVLELMLDGGTVLVVPFTSRGDIGFVFKGDLPRPSIFQNNAAKGVWK